MEGPIKTMSRPVSHLWIPERVGCVCVYMRERERERKGGNMCVWGGDLGGGRPP